MPHERETQVRPFWLVALEHVSIAAAAALLALEAAAVARAVEPGDLGLLAAAFLAALLLADLVSGTVHWIGDTFFETTTPILGPAFVANFREHHRDPQAIVRHGFAERNGSNALAIVVPLLLARAATPPEASGMALGAHAFLLFLTIGSCATNQIHMWAHRERVPRFVRSLQRARLILSPEHHDGHHRGDFRRCYCVTTGWLNPALDAMAFWERSERWLRERWPKDGARLPATEAQRAEGG
jgi:ubiquitin-conjugating enzyme E2 variant